LWFWALLLVPAFAALYYLAQRRSIAAIASIVAPRLRQQLASAVSMSRRILRIVLVLGALSLIVVALAKPQVGYIESTVIAWALLPSREMPSSRLR
jgi:Ca-activated chloride channel family protein